jgi:hypothetical protein
MIMQRATLGNVTQACRTAGISRTLLYRSRKLRQPTPALEHAVLAYALLRGFYRCL